eukprot:GFUD01000288.1.p1 GENE.GFUD01000288.1~~GFUD01000288.1.p1  ORF type:complete len:192 (-),score=60.55 GFUD01000288.1:95-613(-)
MNPEMPSLIPVNQGPSTIFSNNLLPFHPPQYCTKQVSYHLDTSDVELHKNLGDQIQLVKRIQQILGTEQKKLEMMKQFYTRNDQRKFTVGTSVLDPPNNKMMELRKESNNPNNEDESELTLNSQRALEKFRKFWSFDDAFEDEEIEIKQELNTVSIEDLVVEEVTSWRARNS